MGLLAEIKQCMEKLGLPWPMPVPPTPQMRSVRLDDQWPWHRQHYPPHLFPKSHIFPLKQPPPHTFPPQGLRAAFRPVYGHPPRKRRRVMLGFVQYLRGFFFLFLVHFGGWEGVLQGEMARWGGFAGFW